MLTPTVEIKNYFYNTISYNKNEKRTAKDILDFTSHIVKVKRKEVKKDEANKSTLHPT